MSMPMPFNRPGLDALHYRVGTYGTFMRAMTERLSSALPALSTRELDDPSLALLDGWAVIADVLTFYQERIANEGYLRTARDKRSVLQFANLVGYAPRPGVSAGVFLAYTLEKGGDVTLAAGSKAQSVPGPGESAQMFETSDALDARAEWNALGVRTTQPQDPAGNAPFYLSTTTTNLKPNDVLLVTRGVAQGADELPEHRFVRVAAVEPQPMQNRTKITLQGAGLVWDAAVATDANAAQSLVAPSAGTPAASAPPSAPPSLIGRIDALKTSLLRAPSTPPRTPQRLPRTPSEALGPDLDLAPQLFGALHPRAADTVYAALAKQAAPAATAPLTVYAFRVHAAPYGHNAPNPPPVTDGRTLRDGRNSDELRSARNPQELMLEVLHAFVERNNANAGGAGSDWLLAAADSDPRMLSLDARYDRVAPGSYVAIRTYPSDEPVLFTVTDTRERSRRDYGLSATTTVATLNAGYFPAPAATSGSALSASGATVPSTGAALASTGASLSLLRDVDVFAQSEALPLADVPIESALPDDPQASPTILELDGIYAGLASGRWLIVAGTRTDLPGVAGGELAMVAATEHRTNPAIAGDMVHTFVTLSTKLAYTYARGSVTVWGNVVRATNGATQSETIGSGDAARTRQSFALKAKPLTFVSSPTQSGAHSTLEIHVNGVRWTETDDPSALGPTDRAYTTATTDAGTTVTFGDGVHGARLPTGAENITATYRAGLGLPGNVDGAKISLLMSRPLGVKAVANPLPASGGADSQSRDDIRRNLPTALLALDRLVSLDDYANFARTFAGVAKAAVAQLGSGGSSTVALTLAGPGNAAVDPSGDLVANLAIALSTLGDPRQAFSIQSRVPALLMIGARIDLVPNAIWETVEPAIRAALAATFGFAARDFGQPAYMSEAIAAIQAVAGVADVAIDLFTAITAVTDETLARLTKFDTEPMLDDVITPLPARRSGTAFTAAQIVVLDSSVTDTILLRRNTGGGSV